MNQESSIPLAQKPSRMQRRLLTLFAWLLIMAGGLLGVWLAAQTIGQFAGAPPDFDEAVHLLPVRQLAVDVQQGDVGAFLRHTLNQDQLAAYPFFHAWLTFPAWLVAPGITTARTMSAVYLALAALVAFGLGHDLVAHGRFAWLAGLVAGALTLLALPLWAYAGLAYLEGAGLLVTLLALWLYGRSFPADRRKAQWFAFLAGLLVMAAFFTKYNFGLLLMGSIALNELVAWILTRRQAPITAVLRRWLALGGLPAGLLLAWFFWPGHWTRFVAYSGAQEGQLTLWRLASWLYYPRSLLAQYSAGWPIALLVVGGLVYGVLRWRAFRARSLLIFLLLGWLMLTAVPQKEPRFLYTVAPAAFVLAGGLVAATAVWAAGQARRWRLGLAVVGVAWLMWAGTAVAQRFQFFSQVLAAAYASPPETVTAYQFVQAHTLAQNQPVYLLNSWHLFSPPALLWTYYTAAPGSLLAYDDGLVSAGLVPEPTAVNQAELIARLKAQGIRYILSIDGSPAGDYSGWAIIEPLQAQGLVAHVASSPSLTLPVRSLAYQEALLSGEFPDLATAMAQSAQYQSSLGVQLHLYEITGE